MKVSPLFLIPLALSAVLGVIGGSAFRWAAPQQAWNIFIAAFLWTLIVVAGTTIGRFAVERLHRGHWRRGLWVALLQSFAFTTAYLLAAVVVSAGALGLAVAPVIYVCTLVLALALAAMGVLTSPYTR